MTQPSPSEGARSRQVIGFTIIAVVIVAVTALSVTGSFPWQHSGSKGSAAPSGTTASVPAAASGPALSAPSAAAEPTAPASSLAPPPPSAPASALGTYRSGVLTFNATSLPTDLDAPPSDLKWGRGGGADSGFDITANKLGIQPYTTAQLHWDLTPLKPTYAACATDTDTDSDLLAWTDFRKSVFLCIHTNGGRAAIAEITAASSTAVTWKVTVYRKASD